MNLRVLGGMAAELDNVVREAQVRPLASRASLFECLLKSPTYLLRIGEEKLSDDEQRILRGDGASGCSSLSIWAEADAALDGVWVPIFTSEAHASSYVARRALRPPSGRQLHWVRHEPGQVYGLLEAVPCFAGLFLNPEEQGGVRVEWPEANALSEDRLPPDIPVLRSLPVEECPLPRGLPCRVGHLDRKVFGFGGRQVIFPEAGGLELQDFRSLVHLSLDDGEEAWAPCRHFVSVLRGLADGESPEREALEEALLGALISFEMYGEAEAACVRFAADPGRRPSAISKLALVLRRSGRLESCVAVCREGLRDHPDELELYRNLVLSLAQMEELEAAREFSRKGAARFPENETLLRFL